MSPGPRDKLVPYARGRLCNQCKYYYASLISNDYYASLISNDYYASLISDDYYASLVSKAHIDVQLHHNPRASFWNKNYVFNIDHGIQFKTLINHIKYDLDPHLSDLVHHLSDLVHHFETLDVSRCPHCSTHLCRQSWDILWHNPYLWRQGGLPKERCELLPASGGLPQPGR